ncbi:MAG: type I secretion system permease/ATPase [Pseudomonadota bacterium]
MENVLTATAKQLPLETACNGIKTPLIIVAVFSAFINLLMLTAPLYMLQVFDRVLTSQSIDTLIVLSIMAVVALMTFAALETIRSFSLAKIGKWFDAQLGETLLQMNVRRSLANRDSASIQSLRDLNQVKTVIGGNALVPVMDAPWVPLFLGVIFLLHPSLGLLALAAAITLFVLAVINELVTRKHLKAASSAQVQAHAEADAAARNADVIEAMGMFHTVANRWSKSQETAEKMQSRAAARNDSIGALSKFIRMIVQTGMLGLGAWLVIQQQLSPGGMVAGTILLGRALAPIDQAISSWKSLVNARHAYHRIKSLFEHDAYPGETMTLPRPQGTVTCEGISYRHQADGEPTLKNISFELPAAHVLGVVGPSAAGKTTLGRLLVGNLKPTVGSVRLDGNDIFNWSSADRGQYIGYLPQDIELFAGTVRENIARLGQGAADDVIAAAELADVHEMILRLPQGYETQIGEHGSVLSAGQRQRIGLARALYGDPALVVLDEPNSNLDHAGLNSLIHLFKVLKSRGTTVVVIAHQPQIIRHVDALIVVNEGQLQMSGPTEQVLQRISGPMDTTPTEAQPAGPFTRADASVAGNE